MGEGAEVEEGGHCDLIEREGKEGGLRARVREKKKKTKKQNKKKTGEGNK